MKRQILVLCGFGALLLSSECGPKVMIPPRIDLTQYENVGVIGFGCNAEGNMDEFLIRRIIITLRSYQKKARIIELGSEEEILQSVQFDELNSEAIQAIGGKYEVDALITGNLEITEVRPLLKLYRGGERPISGQTQVEGKRASAEVKVWVTAKLWGTELGATLWRVSERGEQMVDQVSVLPEKKVIFDARDPHKAFWDLINPLVIKICDDFKIKYQRIKEN
jgi:hypothetical protein